MDDSDDDDDCGVGDTKTLLLLLLLLLFAVVVRRPESKPCHGFLFVADGDETGGGMMNPGPTAIEQSQVSYLLREKQGAGACTSNVYLLHQQHTGTPQRDR